MHEAFGGQVASNIRAWEQGWKEPAIGSVDRQKLNQLGSSIAVGHPFAATGCADCYDARKRNEAPRRQIRTRQHLRRRRPGVGDDPREALRTFGSSRQ